MDSIPGLDRRVAKHERDGPSNGRLRAGQIGPDASPAAALIERLNDPDPGSDVTIRTLSLIGAPGAPALIATIEHGTEPGREGAAKRWRNST